ncbi:eukaryotic translation initiation factor 3 subunit F-like [Anser cygnoides]|uniref:eukaryotic translation initiation factor 3 subunit F-like n=1 Tax=Anser cygnoides TaxID=8845 RepID=UPI0034D18E1F
MGAPRPLGILLCLLALLGPGRLGASARSLPATIPPTVPAPAPTGVPTGVPTTVPVTVPATVPATTPGPPLEEDEEDDEEEEEEAEGRVMEALGRLAAALQSPRRRGGAVPEPLLELVPELRDLLAPARSPA